jgi:putative hydrolase of the HAD superfamily
MNATIGGGKDGVLKPGDAVGAALFDFGGVVAEEGFRNGLIALAREQGLDAAEMPRQGADAVYDSGFVVGQGSAADFWALLRQRTGLQGEDTELTRRILDGFVVRPWMIEHVRRLGRRGIVTGILSDQTHWLDELDRRDHFFGEFRRVYNSFHLGKGKRDASLFSDVAEDLRLAASAVLFIDDDAGNVRRARDAGFRTIHYTDRQSFEGALSVVLPAGQ